MIPSVRLRPIPLSLALLCLAASLALAQSVPAPAVPATPAAPAAPAAPAPPSPVGGIRNKVSAGDLLSAESILDVHRAKYGEDGPWLVGLTWLARGALLLGEPGKAGRYASEARAQCERRIARGLDLVNDHDTEIAFGAAIEVEAQLRARANGAKRAAEYVRGELARVNGPVALRSRLQKRLNMLELEGRPAPELEIEDWVGARPPSLASLRGRPVMLFLWAEGCGDCKAQAASLASVRTRYRAKGLEVVALTRYYDEGPGRVAEKARVDSVWNAVYADVGTVPIVLSTASMERYGGSSTPTFVFVDASGVVRGYTPTRLTEAEFDRALAAIVR